MNTMITVVGNVVDSPRFRRVKDSSVTNFRLASTGRRFDRHTQQFVDSTTFYVDVECWGTLSRHVSGSVGKGDPVVVLGAISTDEWETDSGRRSKPQITATAVGHDMARGMGTFTRIKPGRPGEAAGTSAGAALEGSPVDPADEEYAGRVDRLTGELLDGSGAEPSEEIDGIRRGRDYVTGPSTLGEVTTDGLTAEPVHA